jgi:RNA polymerase sigma-70 factor (ECF subfamily)
MDDDELIARLAGGDENALRELFTRHAPWLAARLRAALPAGDVEDVLQETFLAAWRAAGSYQPQGSGGGWLWGIARRQAALWLRRQGRANDLVIALGQGARDVADDPTEAVLTRAELAQAVESLGAEDGPEREVWRLLFVEDRPLAQVAELMNVPMGTVKSRAHRVRRLMRAALLGHRPAREGSR